MKPREDQVGVAFSAAEAAYIQPHILKSSIWWPPQEIANADPEAEFCVNGDDALLLLSVFSNRSIIMSHERRSRKQHIPRRIAQTVLVDALEQGAEMRNGIREALQASLNLHAEPAPYIEPQNAAVEYTTY